MTDARWLLLLHQLPPRPAYLRVKVWRRLQKLGAVALRNAVYAMPRTDEALEDLQWVARDITASGGEATICEARLVDGLRDDQVAALFQAARDADYATLAEEARKARKLAAGKRKKPSEELAAAVTRLSERLAEIEAIDFFGAPGREAAAGLVDELRRVASADERAPLSPEKAPRGKSWVTRTGIHVDRIASAWLIRRFIDPAARFRYVAAKSYQHKRGELRFDMFNAEYTHEGDRCTFETLCARFGLDDPALAAIAEIVHDLDLKDDKYGRPETPGVGKMIVGVCSAHRDDDERLQRGSALFDGLYEALRRPERRKK